jgi:hypothetical protein
MNITEIKVGDRVRVIGSMSGANIPLNTELTVSLIMLPNNMIRVKEPQWVGANIYAQDVEFCSITREQLEKRLKEIHEEAEGVQDKLSFLDEVESDTYDTLEFKAYQALQIADEKSQAERAKALANLIRGV